VVIVRLDCGCGSLGYLDRAISASSGGYCVVMPQ